jgi:hypothetical protein
MHVSTYRGYLISQFRQPLNLRINDTRLQLADQSPTLPWAVMSLLPRGNDVREMTGNDVRLQLADKIHYAFQPLPKPP